MNHIKFISTTFEKKTKIKEKNELKLVCNYLNKTDLSTFKIVFGNNIEINLFSIDLDILEKIKIRPETIFKINLLAVKVGLSKYCKNLNFIVKFEESSTIQKNIYQIQNYFKHDAIIQIYNNCKCYEIGLEYNEEKTHNNTRQINNDNSRDVISKMFFHLFLIYYEHKNNYDEFMKNLIYNLITIICSIKKNEYLLAKILFLREEKINLQDEEFFDLIIKWKQNNQIDIKKLHNLINPKDDDGNDYSFNEYLEHLEELQIKINDKSCDYANFTKLLDVESNLCSNRIISFRKIKSKVADKLFCAAKEIINLTDKINEKNENVVSYTEEIIKNLHNINNINLVKIGMENFNKKYNL